MSAVCAEYLRCPAVFLRSLVGVSQNGTCCLRATLFVARLHDQCRTRFSLPHVVSGVTPRILLGFGSLSHMACEATALDGSATVSRGGSDMQVNAVFKQRSSHFVS